MNAFGSTFAGKRVLVTGHTGFKGAWLSEWLLALGAEVTGLSLEPNTNPSLFGQLGLEQRICHRIGDIQDASLIQSAVAEAKPDFIFHLAAQARGSQSYECPRKTFNTNVMGTLHVLEALRSLNHPCAAVLITTDKCYENREWIHGYREEDALGGRDPYSASKAAAELVIASYRDSFFINHPVLVASARAGNVIGGGDWTEDRIIPECIRALAKNEPISIRNRHIIRPWQHVLEPLSGYLWLAALLAKAPQRQNESNPLASAFNFGPYHEANRTVEQLVEEVLKHWSGRWVDGTARDAHRESSLLQLSTDKANALLGWRPVWPFATTIEKTVRWYADTRHLGSPEAFQSETRRQIDDYQTEAARQNLPWAKPDFGAQPR